MKKIIIFGNSGSGKSTIAKKICLKHSLSHLDLDTLAWLPTTPPKRKPLADCKKEIFDFINNNKGWVIEGCYTDLLRLALSESNELFFMNLPIEMCILNAKNRPWEPHKYASKEDQDANLKMLINWIGDYDKRTDNFSRRAHEILYEEYEGLKTMVSSNNNNI